jgi:hypothetical protein
MSSKKNGTISTVQVALYMGGMTRAEKVKFSNDVAATATHSAVFQGSPAAQAALATWQTASGALDKNQSSITQALLSVSSLRSQEAQCEHDVDVAASAYAGVVQGLAKTDPSVVAAMGLTLRPIGQKTTELLAPGGLQIRTTKASVDWLLWDKVKGGLVYVMQYSPTPATDASWVTLAGTGRRRRLSVLTHAQSYVLRVMALGAAGASPWSATLGVVGR